VTLDEYAREIADSLRRAHNSKNLSAVSQVLSGADSTLVDNNIGDADQKEFWRNVKTYFESGNLLFERQANSSLIALMQAIQNGIAARIAKK
jgi:uncharacterized protein (DUF1697 family)